MNALISREEAARRLASFHYEFEPDMQEIFRLRGPDERNGAEEPIKLLEINSATIPSGILPLGFGADPHGDVPYPMIIIEITPEEFEAVKSGRLPLPEGWVLDEPIPRPAASNGNGTP